MEEPGTNRRRLRIQAFQVGGQHYTEKVDGGSEHHVGATAEQSSETPLSGQDGFWTDCAW